jgi:hypothetical protein
VDFIKEPATLVASNNRYWIFVSGVMAVLCACKEGLDPWANVAQDQYTFRLERSGGEGNCPLYSLEVKGTGEVTFIGKGCQSALGRQRYLVSKSTVNGLVTDFKVLELSQASNTYGENIPDAQVSILEVSGGNNKQRATIFGIAQGETAKGIYDFQLKIDRAAQTSRFNQ